MSTAPLATGRDAAGVGPCDEACEPALLHELPVQSLFEGVYARLPCHLTGQRSDSPSVLGSRAALARGD